MAISYRAGILASFFEMFHFQQLQNNSDEMGGQYGRLVYLVLYYNPIPISMYQHFQFLHIFSEDVQFDFEN